ncbi:FCD domain-containing protein [Desulfosarcina ovata]|uniref:GntR family transcriptional regulator n=2 Tax=Desulfosarcina ovata TaxID=83564 RepID=A0A5K8AEV4_9BACT|nr:FCD domain-containing protein [Desulfosarcina ovata]BBO84683.1 GntR family transcriptional regulator [Desulfosarcina ovata subsp. sediminis]BBO91175.1 GntR family transcriptional regulator [Desulfosarcina ovata subsp. ovata]
MPLTGPIKKRKLSDEILERLLLLFETGKLKPEDEMPSERELMERFMVGRPAVREALQSLERMGLIAIRHGERAKVLKPTEAGIFDQIDFAARQLLASSGRNVEFLREARQIMEAGIAKLAVQHATPAGIKALKKHLETMRKNDGNREAFMEADQHFHIALAKMTQNPILHTTMRAVFGWLSQYHAELLSVPGLEDLIIKEHEAILKKIIDRDADGASKQISDHILQVNELYPKHRPK